MPEKVVTFSDGGARGNPGPAGAGAVVYDSKDLSTPIATVSEYLGETTNNIAEYTGILRALEKAKELGATEVDARLDSELVVKQLRGEYKVKNAALGELFIKVYNVAKSLGTVTYTHVYRENNKVADALANQAMDRKS